ncbi:MAG: hypothetical protein KF773_12395 [Deltaproteobacteria bacterium]|nr:hypothetical protein [Deltaproteobacteria bacterium]
MSVGVNVKRLGSRLTIIAVALESARFARADRYEATIVVRSAGTLARVADDGTPESALVQGGGLVTGLSYGVLNWLDIGGEVAVHVTTHATYDTATLQVLGGMQTGELSRTTQLAHVRAGATLRLGVRWVPTLYIGIGAGGRHRSAAQLRTERGVFAPDGQDSAITPDVLGTLRLGLDRRLTRRWSLGICAGATAYYGVTGTPGVQLLEANMSFAYTWYPNW